MRAAVAASVAASGFIHLYAARLHGEHAQVAVFFVLLALAQLVWAGYALSGANRTLIAAGVAMNATTVGLWLASRTVGTPFVPGHTGREPVGPLDVAATALEIVAVVGSVELVAPRFLARVRWYPREVLAAGLAAGLVVLALPPVLGAQVGGELDASHAGHTLALHELTHGATHAGHGAGAHAHKGSRHAGHLHAAGQASHAGHAEHGDHSVHAAHAGGVHVHGSAPPPQLPAARGIAATVRYGPFSLGPAQVDERKQVNPAVSNSIRTRLETPCSSCYLTSMAPDLVYVDGKQANFDTGVMLHHAVLGDAVQSDLTCQRGSTIGWMGRRFFASGNERTMGVLPAPFGYQVGPSDWWTGIFEIMNFSTTPKTVWFKFTVHYLPSSSSDVKPVVPVWMDENNCGSSEYAIPAGKSTTDWDWTSSITGRIVFAGGHVHNYGRKITFTNATRRQSICKSVAGYGHKPEYRGNIESMTSCAWDRIGVVREGETLRISAYYDSPEERDDVMGIVLAYVYETDDLDGGTQAPESVTNPPDSNDQAHSTHHH